MENEKEETRKNYNEIKEINCIFDFYVENKIIQLKKKKMAEPPKKNLICDDLQSDTCGLTPRDIDWYQRCLPAGK